MSPQTPKVPAWLAEKGVKPGDYYVTTKPRTRRMMLNSLSAEARRVYACLELHTMGFRQELAIKLEDGKKRPLTPGDIARQTELDRRKVANAVAELEQQGLAKREATDGGALRKGRIRIYSFAVPQSPAEAKIVTARGDNFPAWLPPSETLKGFLKRNKISVSADFVPARSDIEALEVTARDYETAELRLRAALDSCGAQRIHIRRKEQEGKDLKRDAGGRSVSVRESGAATAPMIRPPVSPSPIAATLKAWLTGRFNLPTEPDAKILAKIAAHIPDEDALSQFKKAAARAKPEKWALFERIAAECAAKRKQKPQAIDREERDRRTNEIMRRGLPFDPADLEWLREEYPHFSIDHLEQIARECAAEKTTTGGA